MGVLNGGGDKETVFISGLHGGAGDVWLGIVCVELQNFGRFYRNIGGMISVMEDSSSFQAEISGYCKESILFLSSPRLRGEEARFKGNCISGRSILKNARLTAIRIELRKQMFASQDEVALRVLALEHGRDKSEECLLKLVRSKNFFCSWV